MWNSREFDTIREIERIERERADRERKKFEKSAEYNIGGGAAVGFGTGLFVDFGNFVASKGHYPTFLTPRFALVGAAVGTAVYAAKKLKPD